MLDTEQSSQAVCSFIWSVQLIRKDRHHALRTYPYMLRSPPRYLLRSAVTDCTRTCLTGLELLMIRSLFATPSFTNNLSTRTLMYCSQWSYVFVQCLLYNCRCLLNLLPAILPWQLSRSSDLIFHFPWYLHSQVQKWWSVKGHVTSAVIRSIVTLESQPELSLAYSSGHSERLFGCKSCDYSQLKVFVRAIVSIIMYNMYCYCLGWWSA